MEEIFVKTADNETIALNHCRNGNDSVLVIAHGWYMTKDTKQFRDISYEFSKHMDVITFDFRGHGRSSGGYTFSAKETKDMEAVIDYAKQFYENINIIGFSLGGTVAILYCAQHNDIKNLITVSAPSDFNRVENKMWSPKAFVPTIGKWLENERHKVCRRNVRIGNPFLKKTKAVAAVPLVSIPHLIIAGSDDPTVSDKHAKSLYKAGKSDITRLEIFENCYHAEDIYYQDNEKFMNTCLDWIKSGN